MQARALASSRKSGEGEFFELALMNRACSRGSERKPTAAVHKLGSRPRALGSQTGNIGSKNRQMPCPGGTCDNSPTFQRWVDQRRDHPVPKGRLKRCALLQPSLRDGTAISLVLPNVETLGYFRASLR